jgi:arylsulfatase A-like enzyme
MHLFPGHLPVFVSLVAGLVTAVSHVRADGPRQPNIIVILADDLGYGELGAYGGHQIPTPNIDSIAEGGVRFTSAYVPSPVCGPSRAGLLTGRYPQRFGFEFNPDAAELAGSQVGLPVTARTLPQYLKQAGYATGMVGKWHLGSSEPHRPRAFGFDEFFGFYGAARSYMPERTLRPGNAIRRGDEPVIEPQYLTDAFGREAVGFIDRHRDRPFFLYLSFSAVHRPLQATEKYLERFSHIQDEARRKFDDAVGMVLATVRDSGLDEDTLIFFLSDNGGPTHAITSRNDPFRGVKGTVWEGGIRVPFIVQWKGRLPAGAVYPAPVTSLDILPTVLAAAGAAPLDRGDVDGVDLVPYLISRPMSVPHKTLYWRYGEHRAIRRHDLKLVWAGDARPQLYNLADDLTESNDLARDQPTAVSELTAEFDRWNAGLGDPAW